MDFSAVGPWHLFAALSPAQNLKSSQHSLFPRLTAGLQGFTLHPAAQDSR